MPVLLHQQPVLTLALESFQDATIDENDIRRMWVLFKKCKDDIKNGFRLENISWRIWYKKYLNNTSDLFSNNKICKKSMESSPIHSVDSNCSNFSLIEPVEVLKKCACGEQLTSSSLNSISAPQREYTSFNKSNSLRPHHQKQTIISSVDHTTGQIIKKETVRYSSATLVKPSVLRQTQTKPSTYTNSEKSVEIHKESELKQEKEEEIEKEKKIKKEKVDVEEEEEEEREESNNKITNEIPREVHHDLHHDVTHEISHEIPHSEIDSEKVMTNDSTNNTTINTNSNSNANVKAHIDMEESRPHHPSTVHPNDHDHIRSYNIPPNCPTLEQYYQQQLLMLQQVYIQKQQQLQYQKQQMNINTEQVCQHQMYLQQWFNQQQQELLSNCQIYYRKYIQYMRAQAQAQARAQAQRYGQVQTEVQLEAQNQAQARQKQTQAHVQTHGQIHDHVQVQAQVQSQNKPLAYNKDDYDEEEDEDDYYYSDEEDENYNENINLQKGMKGKDRKEAIIRNKSKENDLFRKVSTNTLKSKITKPSLLSAMIKENNYNEYKKTIEIIQKCEEDDRNVSNNIYSIKDYNRNCINSLNKTARRRRVPSFEDIRNNQHGFKKLFEMHPLHPITNRSNNNGNNLQEQNEVINSDIEEYYERNPYPTTGNGTNNSYCTVNTNNITNSQDSHTTLYFNHNLNDIYGSNKTTTSTRSIRSTKSCISNRINNNNDSINLYMSKKRLNYSN